MRILCLISAMGPGGAERVMAHLLSRFSARHDVRLVTLAAPGTPSFYALPQSIEVVQLDLLHKFGVLKRPLSILARYGAIRRQLRDFRPDVALSFMDTMNIMATAASYTSGIPVVISERVDPSQHSIGAWKSFLRRLVYPLANRCVVQTERVREYFNRAPRPDVVVIPNPVQIPRQQAAPAIRNAQGRFRIVALGRLESQKGFDRLLESFARLAPAHPDWDLVIFGEGPERKALESQVKKLGLDGRVLLPGITTDPAAELAVSHAMVFPSRYEGFPNALAEGLAAGLPAVGFTGVSGVEDLIADGKSGLLVDPAQEKSALADALKQLMESPDLRSEFGGCARREAKKWQLEIICDRWEALLTTVANSKKPAERA
jgi:glycosyltransferase involved in cell wall biosynthesis